MCLDIPSTFIIVFGSLGYLYALDSRVPIIEQLPWPVNLLLLEHILTMTKI